MLLLLLGPKGVGKTHLGASIIRKAGGTFISIELGCEAERQMKRERWNGRDKSLRQDLTLPVLAMFGNVVTSPKRH